MSLEAITWALKQPVPVSSAKFVLVVMANQAASDQAFASIAYIAEATGQDRKTVMANIRRLVEWGLVSDTGERRGRTGQVPVYRLSLGPGLFDNGAISNSAEIGTGTKNVPVPKLVPVPKTVGNGTNFPSERYQKRDTEPKEPKATKEPALRAGAGAASADLLPAVNGNSEQRPPTDADNGATDAAPDAKRCPVQEIVALYHVMLPMCPSAEKLTRARIGYIRARWREDLPTIEAFRNYFADVKKSRFLTGQVNGSRDRPPFVADLEWLMRPGNFAKVLEGKYHRG